MMVFLTVIIYGGLFWTLLIIYACPKNPIRLFNANFMAVMEIFMPDVWDKFGEKIHRILDRDYARKRDREKEELERRRQERQDRIEKWFEEENERRKKHPGAVRIMTYYFGDWRSFDDGRIITSLTELKAQEIENLERMYGKSKMKEHYVFIMEEPARKEAPEENVKEENSKQCECERRGVKIVYKGRKNERRKSIWDDSGCRTYMLRDPLCDRRKRDCH